MRSARLWCLILIIAFIIWGYWDVRITELQEQNSQIDYQIMELRLQIKRNDEAMR